MILQAGSLRVDASVRAASNVSATSSSPGNEGAT